MSDILKENNDIMMNTKGRVRTLEYNKAVLLVFFRDMEIELAQCTADDDIYGTGLTEHKLFRQTSYTIKVDWKDVRRIYYYFTSEETEQTLDSIRTVYDNSLWIKGSHNYKFHSKSPNCLCLNLIKYTDTKHEKGKKVACRDILNWLRKKHAVYCSKHTLSRAMLGIGLSYKPSKPKMCNNNFSRLDQITDYLISMHAMHKLEKEDKAVSIYLDELYCNTTSSDTH